LTKRHHYAVVIRQITTFHVFGIT